IGISAGAFSRSEAVIRYHTIDDVYNRFLTAVHSLIDRYVPMRRMIHPFDKYPQHIKNLFHQRERLFSTLEDPLLSDRYNRVNRDFTFHLKRYLASKERKLSECRNMKNLFSYARKKKSFCLYDSDGRVLTTDSEKANVLADYFASVFSSTETLLGSTPILVNSECLSPIIDPNLVYKYLRQIKSSCSLPSDKVPAIFFKTFAKKLAVPLCHIFNISLLMGEVPTHWKQSVVTAIPKKPSASTPDEFRPISITPTPCKVMERILKSCLLDWLVKHDLVPHEQFGFIKNSSTCLQLLECTHMWVDALNSSKECQCHAFDTVNHVRLLEKMHSLGIRGALFNWLKSYLSDRNFVVNVYAFADDVKAFTSFDSGQFAIMPTLMNDVLSRMSSWTHEWGLKLNFAKTCVLTLGKRLPHFAIEGLPPSSIVSQARDLGITVSSR
ncbi:hypothetical protein OSTOST_25297, partial [Ostertagia ostertagi]